MRLWGHRWGPWGFPTGGWGLKSPKDKSLRVIPDRFFNHSFDLLSCRMTPKNKSGSVSHSLSHSVSEWQGPLLSCWLQLKTVKLRDKWKLRVDHHQLRRSSPMFLPNPEGATIHNIHRFQMETNYNLDRETNPNLNPNTNPNVNHNSKSKSKSCFGTKKNWHNL